MDAPARPTITARAVQRKKHARSFDLQRRDVQTCAAIQPKYANAPVPVCSGTASICSFSGGQQGCCDDQGSCNFYTACYGYSQSASCSDLACLSCPQSAQYCAQYNYNDLTAEGMWIGYSCVADQAATYYAWPASNVAIATQQTYNNNNGGSQTTTAASVSSTGSSSSGTDYIASATSITSSASRTSSSSSSSLTSSSISSSSSSSPKSSASSTSSSSSPASSSGSTEKPQAENQSKSILGPAIGGAIGGALLLALLIFAFAWCHKRNKDKKYKYMNVHQAATRELAQTAQFGNHPSSADFGSTNNLTAYGGYNGMRGGDGRPYEQVPTRELAQTAEYNPRGEDAFGNGYNGRGPNRNSLLDNHRPRWAGQ